MCSTKVSLPNQKAALVAIPWLNDYCSIREKVSKKGQCISITGGQWAYSAHSIHFYPHVSVTSQHLKSTRCTSKSNFKTSFKHANVFVLKSLATNTLMRNAFTPTHFLQTYILRNRDGPNKTHIFCLVSYWQLLELTGNTSPW